MANHTDSVKNTLDHGFLHALIFLSIMRSSQLQVVFEKEEVAAMKTFGDPGNNSQCLQDGINREWFIISYTLNSVVAYD